ncbi:HDOD domain-containing protein [Desulfurivibrio alkaliphilus]|uniref:Putative signal transduction protein n=1 Tax=Desulfurivibrio alkaliphilus (strain DSM 19089 / UNIQEM U267 / AHT2) TaxID=589865 RepID=D6Z443_DESAT|nr:HDOD domain-containing protein [Desulfurivibrio alkaliphilus]ADH86318.1 putative signal transduction protein [Desulfurivibrio alkaliphilus AHT 2]
MNNEEVRRHIQRLKELPALAPNLSRIIEACEDPEIDFQHLAQVLQSSPTITARLLGLANTAFFGQAGRVQTLEHATAILGLPMVRNIATGLALAGPFQLKSCRRFELQRYWLTSILAASMGRELATGVDPQLQIPRDSVYLAGLLHNFGLLALVHLFPQEMEQALATYYKAPEQRLASHLRRALAIDHYQAGAWLGGKWHLPRELLLVMEHHHDPQYRREQWPLVLLTGFSSRWGDGVLNQLTAEGVTSGYDYDDPQVALVFRLLEIDGEQARATQHRILAQLPAYREMAAALSG